MFVNIMAFMCLVLVETHEALPSIAVLETGVIPIEKGTVGMQFYVDIENMHHWSSCDVYSIPKTCCLYDDPYEDCYTGGVYGDNIESITPKQRRTLIFVFPTMFQYDLVGYCNILLGYKCGVQHRSTQLNIKIPFDTKFADKKSAHYVKTYSDKKKRKCKSVDEDAYNNCAPVKCDLKYNGRRPFYDKDSSKCCAAPECESDTNNELPDIVYIPDSNICRQLEDTIPLSDIYAISSGMGVVVDIMENFNLEEQHADVKINCTTISQNLMLLKDLMTGKLCPLLKNDSRAYADCTKNAILSICACIIATCVLLISILCCIHTTIWLLRKILNRDMQNYCESLRTRFQKRESYDYVAVSQQPSRLCKDVTNNLLKEVIVRDLPIELRDSVVDICDRISREVSHKARYRVAHLGNQLDLMNADSGDTSARSSNKSCLDD